MLTFCTESKIWCCSAIWSITFSFIPGRNWVQIYPMPKLTYHDISRKFWHLLENIKEEADGVTDLLSLEVKQKINEGEIISERIDWLSLLVIDVWQCLVQTFKNVGEMFRVTDHYSKYFLEFSLSSQVFYFSTLNDLNDSSYSLVNVMRK